MSIVCECHSILYSNNDHNGYSVDLEIKSQ